MMLQCKADFVLREAPFIVHIGPGTYRRVSIMQILSRRFVRYIDDAPVSFIAVNKTKGFLS